MEIAEKIRRCGERARGGEGAPAPASGPRRCAHLGDPTGETVPCPTCTGTVQLKVLSCARHGACTARPNAAGVRACTTCPDFTSATEVRTFPAITKTNLLYYVYPVAGSGAWRRCIDRITPLLDRFTGQIVFCVAQDPKSGRKAPYSPQDGVRVGNSTDGTEKVEKRILERSTGLKSRIRFLEVKNDPLLWESKHHNLLFSQVLSTDPTEATLYSHAKGVTRPPSSTAHRWYDALVETLVEHLPVPLDQLTRFPCTGSFLKLGRGFSREESASLWHYSGSFAWYRHDALFARDWRQIDQFRFGIESYPSLHFKTREAGCVFYEGRVSRMNLYSEVLWRSSVEPRLAAFRAANSIKLTELADGAPD